MNPTAHRPTWLTAYGVSMGLLEAIVVVYLRELYYPGGFRFPLVAMPSRVLLIEIAREATTIVMLLSVAFLAVRRGIDRFFVFGFLFGVWDLAYYAALYVLLRWPGSLLAWDVLFLIPAPWIAPVVCPVLVSVLLVGGYGCQVALARRGRSFDLTGAQWVVASLGALTIVVSFVWRSGASFAPAGPDPFPWWLFGAGVTLALAPFLWALTTRAGGA